MTEKLLIWSGFGAFVLAMRALDLTAGVELCLWQPDDRLEHPESYNDRLQQTSLTNSEINIPNTHSSPVHPVIHRPLFPGCDPDEMAHCGYPRVVDILRESIWISYHSLVNETCTEHHHLCHLDSHERLATPVAAWERLKIGGGTPPILTRHGWLTVYHGVSELLPSSAATRELCYSAGMLVLAETNPQVIRYRSPEPVLTPELHQERHGVVPNVVFPTAIDRRDDIGLPDCFDVYYVMADKRIGVARLTLPEHLPSGALADAPQAKV